MMGITEKPSIEWPQYMALAVLSLGAVGATAILYPPHGEYFQPIFGSVNPLLAVALVTVFGGASLGFLRDWFSIFRRRETLKGLVLSAIVATVFAIPTILVDLGVGIPLELNVPPPWSLLFYPAIGYVAELSFHVIPLALLLAFLGPLSKTLQPNRLVWLCILLVAVLEPIFQLLAGRSDQSLSCVEVYVGVHVFAFNLVQLYIFRRFDFMSMYSFRLAYYFWWHILWGYVRL